MSLAVLILQELVVSQGNEDCSTTSNSVKKEIRDKEFGTIQIRETFLFL